MRLVDLGEVAAVVDWLGDELGHELPPSAVELKMSSPNRPVGSMNVSGLTL